tara:strand:- start:8677 stop:9681 length:1005 start_codon:yes stop_codon:yes gene_type:complete
LKQKIYKIAVVYSHHKLGDLIWQLPYIKSISRNFKQSVTLITRSKTQAKDILKDNDFVNKVFYCEFRKKIWYFIEILNLYLFFKKEKFSHVFILDKISRPAIAAKLANIKNIIGPGIKNQKKWLTNKNFLTYEDYQNLDYSDQSKKMLENNNYKIFETIPSLIIKKETLINVEPKIENNNETTVSFGVDSFELFKMWFEENFAELANKLINTNLAKKIYLISSPKNQHVIKKIIHLSGKNVFHDCSSFNLLQVVKVIKHSNYFVGNNSGPLNLSSALGVKTFGLIANDRVTELKNSNIIPIIPQGYKNEINRDREGMRRLDIETVFNKIKSNLV